MIYSKFGTELKLVSKRQSTSGAICVQATVEGTDNIHEYEIADLKADDGMTEINAVIAKLPLKVFENKQRRRPSF